METITIALNSFISINWEYIAAGMICLVVAAFLRNNALDQMGRWSGMWLPVQPTLTAKPSPIEGVRQGCVGCVVGIPARILQWIFVFVGLDLVLFQGRVSQWMWSTMTTVVNAIATRT